MAGAVSLAELTDPAFLTQVGRLRLVARNVPPGGRFADQRSNEKGAGIEFLDHRGYAPGDDLRKVDWHLYKRLGKLFVRQFEELEDLPVYLLPDTSQSAFHGDPPRARAGIFVAAALASVALSQHDKVGVMPFAQELELGMPPTAGAGRLVQVMRTLADLKPAGGTDLVASLKRFGGLGLRRGLAVVISDLFDPAGAEAVTRALSGLRHRVLVVQLVRATDRDPGLSGEARLVDCEGGGAADVSITPAVLARYRDAYDRFQHTIASFAGDRGHGLVQVDADAPVIGQLTNLFPGGRLLV
ncbi:MAG: hypothetical protein ACI8QC_003741 [Planctomycetota bacterium]|jgi:uncharacterized protein (DUF58 family)